jgi:hypothetical protein
MVPSTHAQNLLDSNDPSIFAIRTNGPGKSTVLLAAHALHWMVGSSSALGRPGSRIAPYEPFRLDAATRDAPVTIGCDVVLDGKVRSYEISFRSHLIEHERLTLHDPAGDNVLIYRPQSGEVQGSLIAASESNRLYVKEMQPNVAVLSKLAQHGPSKGRDSVQPYYKAILAATRWKEFSSSAMGNMAPPDQRLAQDADYQNWIMRHLIRPADLGIEEMHTRIDDIEYPEAMRKSLPQTPDFVLPDKQLLLSFIHRGKDRQAIEYSAESAGTRKLLNISEELWILAHESVATFADELSASLHPRLLDVLVRAINEPDSQRIQSQLIFATHDTSLLEGRDGLPPALRRDQVYFTKKGTEGMSELYSLAEFKDNARPNHNLRKRYMEGLYGAIPLVEKLTL